MLYEMVQRHPAVRRARYAPAGALILSRRPSTIAGRSVSDWVAGDRREAPGSTPADRYESAQNVREDLERFRSGNTTQAETGGLAEHHIATRNRRGGHDLPSDIADEEKTRRTRTPGEADCQCRSAQTPHRPSEGGRPDDSDQSDRTKSRRLLRAALILIVLGIIMNEIWVAGPPVRSRRRYRRASWNSLAMYGRATTTCRVAAICGFGTMALERSLTRRTSTLADRVIADYRCAVADRAERRNGRWRATRWRARSRSADTTSIVRAALRYCEGHLHRINGEAEMRRRESGRGAAGIDRAVAAFARRRSSAPGWPDPFLGLARTFIYGLEDVDRAPTR